VKVSVILPTYNEAGNIVRLVEEIAANIPAGWQQEILVVDDNSPDGTHRVASERFANDPGVKVILRTKDRGFAKSIRHGLELATGDFVCVMDTDFTHDPVEIPRMLHIAQVYDIVSGSRFCAGGNMQDTQHYLASLAYNWFIRVIIRTQIQDNLGGYWVMRRDTLLTLPFDEIFYGYGEYYLRMLHFAQKSGLTVVEIPAIYRVRTYGTSKSNFLKMLFTYSRAAIRMRARGRKAGATTLPSQNASA
jgi:dolichol-phosphate mannosyltransferase